MRKLFLKILYTFYLISLFGCETVSKKIEDTTAKEEKKMMKWLNKSESSLKIEFGQPDKINFKESSRNRFYVYISKKYNIKCERIFELDARNIVVGYTSKNCF